MLYSTNATWQKNKTDLGTFGNVSVTLGPSVTFIPNNIINSTTWTDPYGTTYNITILYDAMAADIRSENISATDDIRLQLDIKIRPESSYVKVHNSTYYGLNNT